MGIIGRKDKTVWTEELSVDKLRWNFLSSSTVRYHINGLYVFSHTWESDFLALTKSGYLYEGEVKISKSDFKADFKKKDKHTLLQESYEKIEGVEGKLRPHYFFYVVPEKLITEDEVPEYAGLIYVHATIIGNSRVYYQFQEIKAAPKLHSNKIDENNLKLIDKFYYNYIHWKHKHEKDLIECKELLEKYRSSEGKTYKYTLPQAMEEISRLEKESKMWCENAENWKKLAQEEIRIQRRLTRKLVELGVTDRELEEIIGQTIIYND
jgi:hypothetical protein